MTADIRELLQSEGVSDQEIQLAASEGWLPLLVIDHLLMPGKHRYTEVDVAGLARADSEVAKRLWRAMGFPDAAPDDPVFTDADVEALRMAIAQLQETIPDTAPIESAIHETRVVSSAIARIAEVATDRLARVLEALRESGMGEYEIAEAIASRLDLPRFDWLFSYMYRRQFRAAMWRKLATAADGTDTPGLAVGFVDIVRFTVLARQLGPPELADLISRFEAVTHDIVAARGGRVVKTIGDEVMFVADDPASAVRIGLEVIEAHAADDLLPDVRIGLAWGPAISRDGDYYGPIVNLASRIVSASRPGKFLVSDETRAALRDDPEFEWRRTPLRNLKEIGVVKLWAPRRARLGEDGADRSRGQESDGREKTKAASNAFSARRGNS